MCLIFWFTVYSKFNCSLFEFSRRHYISVLSSMNDETTRDVYGPLLECACSWGQTNDVLELINDRLLSGLQESPVQVIQLISNLGYVRKCMPCTCQEIGRLFTWSAIGCRRWNFYTFQDEERFISFMSYILSIWNMWIIIYMCWAFSVPNWCFVCFWKTGRVFCYFLLNSVWYFTAKGSQKKPKDCQLLYTTNKIISCPRFSWLDNGTTFYVICNM